MTLIPSSFTKRVLVVGLLAGSGMLSAPSFAVSPATHAGNMNCAAKHGMKTPAERMEMRSKHMSALKEKLKLSVQQEAAWGEFANMRQARMHPIPTDAERQARKAEFAKLTTPQRLDKMLAKSDMRRAKMLERAQATKAFYAQLSPDQQAVFDAEAKPKGRWGRGGHHHQT